MKVLVLGGAACNTLLHVNELPDGKPGNIWPNKVVYSLGSTGIGKTIPLAKLGFDVSFHAMIGDDTCGKMIINELKQEGVDFIYNLDPKGTLKHINLLNQAGERISIFEANPTFNPTFDESEVFKKIDEADVVVVNIINYTRRFLSYIKKQHKPIWIDIHDYDGKDAYYNDYIKYASVIQMNKQKIDDLEGFVSKMNEKGVDVIVTDGVHGIDMYANNGKIYHQEVVKTTDIKGTDGAGDHFFVGYLFGYLNQLNTQKSLLCGATLATACIESETISNDIISKDWLLTKV